MKTRLTLALGFAAALLGAGPAGAAPTITEFPLPDGTTPQDIVLGPDGNLWFAEQGADMVGRVIPSDPPVIEHFTVVGLTAPRDITVGPDGNIWVSGTVSGVGGVGRIDPGDTADSQSDNAYGLTDPRGITPGPDGNIWVGSGGGDIVRVVPSSLAEFDANIPTGLNIRNLVKGPDDNMWVTDFGGTIGKVSAAGEFDAADTIDVPANTTWDILSGPGGNLWYSSPDSNVVGRLTTAGVATEFPVTPAGDQFGLAVGADGALWVAQAVANSIGRVTTEGAFTEITGVTAAGRPEHIAAGPNNTMWFTEKDGNRIGRITGLDIPQPAPPPNDTVAPAISGLSLTAKRFRLGSALPRVAAVKTGTRIRFSLSEASRVTLAFKRRVPGRRVGGRCVKPKRTNRAAKRCTRLVSVKQKVRVTSPSGARSIRFAGRLTPRKRLKPGPYQLTVTATDAAGNVSSPDRTTFRLLAAKRKRR